MSIQVAHRSTRFRRTQMVSFPRPTNRYTESPSLAEGRSRQGGVFARIRHSPAAADVRANPEIVGLPLAAVIGIVIGFATRGEVLTWDGWQPIH